jgi:hypothetical protein
MSLWEFKMRSLDLGFILEPYARSLNLRVPLGLISNDSISLEEGTLIVMKSWELSNLGDTMCLDLCETRWSTGSRRGLRSWEECKFFWLKRSGWANTFKGVCGSHISINFCEGDKTACFLELYILPEGSSSYPPLDSACILVTSILLLTRLLSLFLTSGSIKSSLDME